MKSIYGITDIHVKGIIINTGNGYNMMDEVNKFLEEYDGNIIDISYVGQFSGQVLVNITYKYKEVG